jgi:predicted DNA-binding transcriptional regulator AlpA
MEEEMNTKRYLQISDLATTKLSNGLLPVSPATCRRMVKQGRLPAPFKLGIGTTVWDADEVEAAIERLKSERASKNAPADKPFTNGYKCTSGVVLVVGRRKTEGKYWAMRDGDFLKESYATEALAKRAAEIGVWVCAALRELDEGEWKL